MTRRMRMPAIGGVIVLAIGLFFVFCIVMAGCENVRTPAGYAGYVTRGAIVGKARYYGTQVGPTSSGWKWLLHVQNIDIQWQTYNEEFNVMSADNLMLTFNAHCVIRPDEKRLRETVEIYGGPDWYQRTLQEPFRNAVYEAVAGYKALDAKEKREEIAAKVISSFSAYLKDKPFLLNTIVVGTINLPESVAKAQEAKIAKETEIEQKKFEIEIERKNAEKRIIEAEGIAKAQEIINKTLTLNYLQHEGIKALSDLAHSPNTTIIGIPLGTNMVPVINTTNLPVK